MLGTRGAAGAALVVGVVAVLAGAAVNGRAATAGQADAEVEIRMSEGGRYCA